MYVARLLLRGKEQMVAAVTAGDVNVLPHLDEARRPEDHQPAVPPGVEPVRRVPVNTRVTGGAFAAQPDFSESSKPGQSGLA